MGDIIIEDMVRERNEDEYNRRLGLAQIWGNRRGGSTAVSKLYQRMDRPKCPVTGCHRQLELIGSRTHNFIGYRCPVHTDFYTTSIFMNAVIDVEKAVDKK